MFECSKKEKFKEFIHPKKPELFQSACHEAEEEVSKKALSNSMDDELKLIKAKENANASDIKPVSPLFLFKYIDKETILSFLN